MQNIKLNYKRIVFFIIVFLITFTVLIRIVIIHKVNRRFQNMLDYDSNLAYAKYYLEEDGYIYRYRPAGFFNNDAFASVICSDKQKLYFNANGEMISNGMQITLFIWPLKDELGLDFYEKTIENELSMQVYINFEKKCVESNLSESEIEYIDEMINEYEQEIDNLIEKADRRWSIKK